jgi:hypothetical protein
MRMSRREWIIVGQAVLMLASIFILSMVGAFSLELFSVISFVGFLFLVTVTTPLNTRLPWRRRLGWPIAIGLAVFTFLLVRAVLQGLPERVVGL